jgi:hypothetical protein
MGQVTFANIGPASSALTMRMIVTPVSDSPAIYRAMDGRRAAILRQEARTLIVAEPRGVQDLFRQNLP